MKKLYILRGLPGSGKTTFGEELDPDFHYEADFYFYDADGKYKYIPEKIGDAHNLCREMIEMAMEDGDEKIVVSNTFTTESELQPYLDLAKQYNYQVFCLIIENRHGNKSKHEVPEEVMEKMKKRFTVKL
jgi:predicted kinase